MNNEHYYGVTMSNDLSHAGKKGMKWGFNKGKKNGNRIAEGIKDGLTDIERSMYRTQKGIKKDFNKAKKNFNKKTSPNTIERWRSSNDDAIYEQAERENAYQRQIGRVDDKTYRANNRKLRRRKTLNRIGKGTLDDRMAANRMKRKETIARGKSAVSNARRKARNTARNIKNKARYYAGY